MILHEFQDLLILPVQGIGKETFGFVRFVFVDQVRRLEADVVELLMQTAFEFDDLAGYRRVDENRSRPRFVGARREELHPSGA